MGYKHPAYKAEVIADDSGKWVSNSLVFATEEEAMSYAKDLRSRWTMVRDIRVVPVTRKRVNYVWTEDGARMK